MASTMRGRWQPLISPSPSAPAPTEKETGDIILINSNVRDVVAGIRLSRATLRKIEQNLFWAFI
jgi:cation transport ATPase